MFFPDNRPVYTDDRYRNWQAAFANEHPSACFSPPWSVLSYNSDKFVFYGEGLMKRSMADPPGVDADVLAAARSDFSPGPFAPLMGIQGMVTRTGWDGKTWRANQRITVVSSERIKNIPIVHTVVGGTMVYRA